MHEREKSQHHEEFELLLPWYCNGTLEADVHARVQLHLDSCPECSENAELLSRMREAAVTESPAPLIPRPRIEKILGAIERGDSQKPVSNPKFSALAVAAAAAVVVLGVAFIVGNLTPNTREPLQFETATLPQESVAFDYILAVQFESGTQPAEREQLVEEIGGDDLGPGAVPGSYRISVQLPAATVEDLERYTNQIEAREIVRAVQIVAVQLPVR